MVLPEVLEDLVDSYRYPDALPHDDVFRFVQEVMYRSKTFSFEESVVETMVIDYMNEHRTLQSVPEVLRPLFDMDSGEREALFTKIMSETKMVDAPIIHIYTELNDTEPKLTFSQKLKANNGKFITVTDLVNYRVEAELSFLRRFGSSYMTTTSTFHDLKLMGMVGAKKDIPLVHYHFTIKLERNW